MSDNARYIDFDAARAERKKTPLIVKLFGREWELPSSLPADVPLDVARMYEEKGPNAAVSENSLLALMSRAIPEDLFEQWCELGLDAEDYGELLIMIIRVYQGKSDGEQGEAKAPEAGASA